jgi:uncharacterized protein (UPF0305 family)
MMSWSNSKNKKITNVAKEQKKIDIIVKNTRQKQFNKYVSSTEAIKLKKLKLKTKAFFKDLLFKPKITVWPGEVCLIIKTKNFFQCQTVSLFFNKGHLSIKK